ncbi:hypothetical protein [Aeromicrobium sp. P5_D10]
MTSRTLRLAASATSTFALIAAGIAATTSTATAAPSAVPIGTPCPDVFPADELTPFQEVTGLTTAGRYKDSLGVTHDSTETPEEFTGTYIGTVEDDSGDLFVFQTAGSRITKANGDIDAGIWSGMSGSPVYAADGRLIGAVSYTFGEDGASEFAGVTPAADMYDLLDGPALLARTAAAPKTVKTSSSEKSKLVRSGVPATAAGQLRRLDPVPLVSGGKNVKPATIAAIARKAGQPVPRVAGSGGSTQGRDIPIVPGGNLAASDSYGSVASYGVGTATAICGNQVLAFGHPYEHAPSTKAIHGASAVMVQAAGAFSFKMANLGAPSGTLAKDGLHAILGKLGAVPTYPTITSTTNGRSSVSTVPNPKSLAFIAATQAYRDSVLSLDQDAGGEAVVSWRINYTRANGAQQSFSRSERYSSSDSIGEEIVLGLAGDISTIFDNEFENVKITGVSFTNKVTPKHRAYKIGSVDVRAKGKWNRKSTSGSKVTVRAGKKLTVRVNLVKADKKSHAVPMIRTVTWKVPKSARGASLATIVGNSSGGDEFEEFEEFEDVPYECDEDGDCYIAGEDTRPKSFDQLIQQMKSLPRQDTLSAALMLSSGRSYARTVKSPVIVSGEFKLKVNVRK